jgi:hypothetical protein
MSNKFAPVLMALQETFASQGGTPRTWDASTLIVEKADEKGSIQWWVDAKKVDTVLDDDAYELLLNEGMLVDDGKLRRIVKGRTARQALGVMLDELKSRARKEEQSHSKLLVMQTRTKQLERELKLAREQSAADNAMAALIDQISEHFGGKVAKPLQLSKLPRLTPQKGRALAGVPTLLLSDWHYGEVVDPRQVEGLNEYNIDIAERRAERVFNKTLELLFRHQSGQTYEAAVVPLGGDMTSGNIHDELRITNEAPLLETVLRLMRQLERGLLQFAQNFPGVYVPCVVGNHGRMDKKPSAKNKVKDNYDWLLYKMLEHSVTARLGDQCNVAFAVSPSADLPYSIYGTRYLLTHGDQFKSAGGVGGIFPGLMKTDYRKRKRSMQTGRGGYDRLVMGHWHQYGSLESIIVNGSLKGIDEYAYQMNLGFEPAQQALWMTHPEFGITYHSPILAEEPETGDDAKYLPPVTCSMQATAARIRNKAKK